MKNLPANSKIIRIRSLFIATTADCCLTRKGGYSMHICLKRDWTDKFRLRQQTYQGSHTAIIGGGGVV